MLGKAKQLGNELLTWQKAGYPLRPAQLVREIFATHCKPCEHFKGGNAGGRCDVCGCSVRRERASLNKISMATAKCPEEKWLEYTGAIEFQEPTEPARKARGCCS